MNTGTHKLFSTDWSWSWMRKTWEVCRAHGFNFNLRVMRTFQFQFLFPYIYFLAPVRKWIGVAQEGMPTNQSNWPTIPSVANCWHYTPSTVGRTHEFGSYARPIMVSGRPQCSRPWCNTTRATWGWHPCPKWQLLWVPITLVLLLMAVEVVCFVPIFLL